MQLARKIELVWISSLWTLNLFCFAIDQSLQTILRSLARYADIQDIQDIKGIQDIQDKQDMQDMQEYNTQGISYRRAGL